MAGHTGKTTYSNNNLAGLHLDPDKYPPINGLLSPPLEKLLEIGRESRRRERERERERDDISLFLADSPKRAQRECLNMRREDYSNGGLYRVCGV